jgi:hypothetical protein
MRAGNSTELIRILMDHSSIVTTQGYLHASDSDLRRAVRRLPRLRVEPDLEEDREVFPAGNTSPWRGTPSGSKSGSRRSVSKLRTEVDVHENTQIPLDGRDRTL